jgi:hypothetical protein
MSALNNNDNNNQSEMELLEELRLEGTFPIPLTRCEPIRPGLVLSLDEDLYRCFITKDKEIVKSWITDKEVENRVYNEAIGRIVKIDPSIPDKEDRRLLIAHCKLAEKNY